MVTLPWVGGVTRRIIGRGPEVQSGRTLVKIPTLMFVSGFPLTWRSVVCACPKATVGRANNTQIDIAHFIAAAEHS
jgi:hypothetical protein